MFGVHTSLFAPDLRTLRAQTALYGRAFLDLYNPSDFVEMGRALKVLNTVRYYEVGFPLTYAQ
jgi:hypothetical protein